MNHDYPSRRKIIVDGMLKKRTKNQMTVGDRVFLISDELARRIRKRNWLIGSTTFLLSLIYLYSMEKFNMPASEVNIGDGVYSQGLSYTFIFISAVVILAVIFLVTAIPKNVQDHIIKELY
ncbi:hypothetical protein VXN63_08515 [Marinilactibacillus sp. XAAS-LB27]|uniref:hypothetical protein n=1 Tax=Marinilactibacillus sp. XAAS-LB27 TaxID=3114538 RepID=UPI002E18C815|nr:hypothetical protein [Marinilactibacillus sp. XAAS-LB27]